MFYSMVKLFIFSVLKYLILFDCNINMCIKTAICKKSGLACINIYI